MTNAESEPVPAIPDDVELPDPANSIDHADVAPIEEVDYGDPPESATDSGQ